MNDVLDVSIDDLLKLEDTRLFWNDIFDSYNLKCVENWKRQIRNISSIVNPLIMFFKTWLISSNALNELNEILNSEEIRIIFEEYESDSIPDILSKIWWLSFIILLFVEDNRVTIKNIISNYKSKAVVNHVNNKWNKKYKRPVKSEEELLNDQKRILIWQKLVELWIEEHNILWTHSSDHSVDKDCLIQAGTMFQKLTEIDLEDWKIVVTITDDTNHCWKKIEITLIDGNYHLKQKDSGTSSGYYWI